MVWGELIEMSPAFDPLGTVVNVIDNEIDTVKMDIADGDGSEYLQTCKMMLTRLRDRAQMYHKLALEVRHDEQA